MKSELLFEIWKPIKGYEGLYEVSNFGRVKSLTKNKIMNRHMNRKDGYLTVGLWKDGKGKYYCVHRLVAEAFIPNPYNLTQVNHKDENKLNNFVFVNPDGSVDLEKSNLEWCDAKYNNNYGTRIKRQIEKRSKVLLQLIYPEGKFIKEWPSIREAARNGFDKSCISLCCNGKLKKHHGYMFKFKKEEN